MSYRDSSGKAGATGLGGSGEFVWLRRAFLGGPALETRLQVRDEKGGDSIEAVLTYALYRSRFNLCTPGCSVIDRQGLSGLAWRQDL